MEKKKLLRCLSAIRATKKHHIREIRLHRKRSILGLIPMFPSILLVGVWAACGENLFKSTEQDDPAEDATLHLERNSPDDAIKILEKALAITPGEARYLSILAAAYAQRAGIEPLAMAQNFSANTRAQNASTSLQNLQTGSDQTSLISLFSLMPLATASSVADINRSVSILKDEMTQDQWLAGDRFKLGIYQMAATVLNLKLLDTNNDGTLSAKEIAAMASASTILGFLSSSQSTLAQEAGNPAAVATAQSLAQFQRSIGTTEGKTDDEKLKNYLAKVSPSVSKGLMKGNGAVRP